LTGLEQAAVAFARSIRSRRTREDAVVRALDPVVPSQVVAALADFERARVEERAAGDRYRDELTREAAG
jgi:hypothetical protein